MPKPRIEPRQSKFTKPGLEPRQSIFTEERLIEHKYMCPKINTGLELCYYL